MRLTPWLCALSLALLAGCAGMEQRDAEAIDWPRQGEQLAAMQNWVASGKIAIRNDGHAENAAITWQQQGDISRIQLSGPLGAAATRIVSDGYQLTIERGDRTETLDISTPEAIVLSTGWDLPIQALPFWLRGLPAPDAPVEHSRTDRDHGGLVELQQSGWTVHFEDYGLFDSLALPTRLRVEKDRTSARLLLRRWQTEAG